jgi:DUF1680 family protein
MSNLSQLMVNGKKLSLKQSTSYPWNGDIKIELNPSAKQTFNLKIRIPGWVQGQVVPGDLYAYSDNKNLSYKIKVNGQVQAVSPEKGYISLNRSWKKGDVVEVHFDMEARTVKANDKVEADKGRIAVERGPLVYCAEWPDNNFNVLKVMLNKNPEFELKNAPELLNGIQTLQSGAQIISYNENGKIEVKDVNLTMIPYFAWANRGKGNMTVWLRNELIFP